MHAAVPARRRDGGMTLIEVLVSLLLLSFVIVGAVSLITLAMKQNKLAGKRSEATSLAVERIDSLTARPFRAAADYTLYQLPGEVANAGPPRTLTANYGSIEGYPGFRRRLTLVYDVPAAGMLEAKVDVSWVDRTQGEKTQTLVTYLHPMLETR